MCIIISRLHVRLLQRLQHLLKAHILRCLCGLRDLRVLDGCSHMCLRPCHSRRLKYTSIIFPRQPAAKRLVCKRGAMAAYSATERIVFALDTSTDMRSELRGDKQALGVSRIQHIHSCILNFVNAKKHLNNTHQFVVATVGDSCVLPEEFTRETSVVHRALAAAHPVSNITGPTDVSDLVLALQPCIDQSHLVRVILVMARITPLTVTDAAKAALQNPHMFVDVLYIGPEDCPEDTIQALDALIVPKRSFLQRTPTMAGVATAMLRLLAHPLQRLDPNAMHASIEDWPESSSQ
eukprot:m.142825 g.142825  ORF g.142825 m.142825 type:complete len:293 (-) comp9654_c1_seq3:3015-3893(-)